MDATKGTTSSFGTAVSAVLAIFFVFVLGGGCASRPLQKIDADAQLPTDFQGLQDAGSAQALRDFKDFEARFAVREEPVASGAPAAQGASATGTAAPAGGAPALNPAEPNAPALNKRSGKNQRFAGAGSGPAAQAAAGAVPAGLRYPSRRPSGSFLRAGEAFTYEITYFGVLAGEVVLSTQPPKMIGERRVYHFRADIESSPVFTLFYRMKDYVESFWDYEGLFSHRYHVVLDEKSQTRDALELYDHVRRQSFYWNRWNHVKKGYVETRERREMVPFGQDALSQLYYLRAQQLEVGKPVNYPAIADGKSWEVRGEVLRRERRDTVLGPRDCFVLKPHIYYEGKLQKKGEILLWMTDDEHRYPVHLESKVKLGTIHMTLKKLRPGGDPIVLPASGQALPAIAEDPGADARPLPPVRGSY
jgi:hypothetical protein